MYHRLGAMEDANLVPLNKMEIWVQVHDRPSGMVSEKILDSIGSQVGDVTKMDPTNTNGMWKQYMRIRVALNIEKPLKRRIKLKCENGSWSWINFKYERLGTFCFVCGRIGHSDRDCEIVYANSEKTVERAYGVWLRAPNKNAKLQQMGSKWLRNGKDSGQSRWSDGGGMAEFDAKGGGTVAATFMETDGVVRENLGGEDVIRFRQRESREKQSMAGYPLLKTRE